MIIAQTGQTSPSLSSSPSDASLLDYGMWWLIPLSVGVFASLWYIFRKRTPLETKLRPAGRHKSKESDSSKASVDEAKIASSSDINHIDVAHVSTSGRERLPNKTGGKRKKKSKHEVGRKSASVSSPSVAHETTSAPLESNGQSSRLTVSTIAATLAVPTATAPLAAPPANPIFEPLRDVTHRRPKPDILTNSASYEAQEEGMASTISGGKFERLVPRTAATRSMANRWPAPPSEPTKVTAEPALATHASSSPTLTPSGPPVPTLTQSGQTVSATQPAKGLTSFVSKVKRAAGTEPYP